MKFTRTYLIVLLALTLAAGSVLGWRQYQELVGLRAQVTADRSADLLKRLAEAQKRIKDLQDRLAASSGSAEHAGRTTAATETPDDGPPGGRSDLRGAFRSAMNNPAFVKLMTLEQKAGLDGKYASLFRTLAQNYNLSPEQIDHFKNLMVQKQQAVMDAMQAAREQGLNPRSDPEAFGQALSAAQGSMDQQIQAALGAGAYAQYQQYEQTLPQRNTVNSVQQALSYSSTPLTDDQANQLVQILAQDQPPKSSNGPTNIRALLGNNATSPITAQAVSDASSVLTQPQLQALQQVQQTQAARQQMRQLMFGSSSASAPPPPQPGG